MPTEPKVPILKTDDDPKSAMSAATIGMPFDSQTGDAFSLDPNANAFEVGGKLGKYQLTAFLGKGGMGEVYKGFDPLIEREVALKVLPAAFSSNQRALQRFLAEARAVGRLIHPHNVALYEIGNHGESYFLAMEFVSGGSITGLLKNGPIPYMHATRLAMEMCLGLAAAHAVGLVHRDIKPDNLMIAADGSVKITDFGLAKAADDTTRAATGLTQPGELLGTPFYMSPEQCQGSNVDARADIYSAGATYYHILTGERPFSESATLLQVMYAHCHSPIPDLRALRPDLPEACAVIVRKSMAKDPADRYQTANEMTAAFAAVKEPAKPAEIWIIEPSKLQVMVLVGHLKSLGSDAKCVFGSIADTLANVGKGLPAAIITAMHLPDGTGLDLAQKIHALPGGQKVKCVIISTDSGSFKVPPESIAKQIALLPKPVTREALGAILSGLTA